MLANSKSKCTVRIGQIHFKYKKFQVFEYQFCSKTSDDKGCPSRSTHQCHDYGSWCLPLGFFWLCSTREFIHDLRSSSFVFLLLFRFSRIWLDKNNWLTYFWPIILISDAPFHPRSVQERSQKRSTRKTKKETKIVFFSTPATLVSANWRFLELL